MSYLTKSLYHASSKKPLTNGSHLRPQTLAHYRSAFALFEGVLVDMHGPLRSSCATTGVVRLANYSLSELCSAAVARMLAICLSTASLKPDGQLALLSSALNYYSVRQECEPLNPFKTAAVKWKKAALSATLRKLSGGRTHAPGISSDGLRRVVSWLVSADPGDATRPPGGMSHASVHVRLASVRLAAALVVAWWTAMRGGSLLGLRAEHIQVLDDASNSLLKYTMCVWLPTQKNDVEGAKGGAWFPLTPNARDAYLCPALWTSIWLDLNADSFVAAARSRSLSVESLSDDTSRSLLRVKLLSVLAPSAVGPGVVVLGAPPPTASSRGFSAASSLPRPVAMTSETGSYLFSASGDVTRPWSKSAAGSALAAAVAAALGPGVRATFHSARQSFMTRAAIAGLSQTASSTWGGWEGHDVLHYARQDLDAMLVVGRQLAGMSSAVRLQVDCYGRAAPCARF